MTRGGRRTRGAATASALLWWRDLPEPHRRSLLATVGGLVALLMLIGLFPAARGSALASFSVPVGLLFGWGAALVLAGALLWAGASGVEAIRGQPPVPARIVLGVALGVALTLGESHLIAGGMVGGVVGALVAWPTLVLPAPARHILLVGALALDVVIAGRIAWRDLAGGLRRLRWPAPATPIVPPAPFTAAPSPAGFAPEIIMSAPSRAATVRQPTSAVSADAERHGASPPPRAAGLGDSDAFEALRVPAYLRRAQGGPPPARTSPLAGAPRVPRSISEAPAAFALPPLSALPAAGSGVAAARPPSAGAPPPVNPVRATRATAAAPAWPLPPLSLLDAPPAATNDTARAAVERQAATIERALRGFGVEVEVRLSDISVGPTVTRFGLRPKDQPLRDERGRAVTDANGDPVLSRARVSRIMNLRHDLALALAVPSLRMEAPVPSQPYIGVEVPNATSATVPLGAALASPEFSAAAGTAPLAIPLGRDVTGQIRVGDLARFPHVLIAGATGAGKSAWINALLATLLLRTTPDDARLVLIDTKLVELTPYADLPHLLCPVITRPEAAAVALERAVAEMERRYQIFARLGQRNLEGYQAARAADPTLENLPRIVIVIDDLADLMMVARDAVERHIARLAQLARATGIHLVVATQRPSVDVITGVIKANIPTRVAFMVSSAVDSRTILDHGGAELLLGRGDLLFQAADAPAPERVQGAWITDAEIARLVQFWRREASVFPAQPTRWDLAAPDDFTPATDWDDPADRPRRARVPRRRAATHR